MKSKDDMLKITKKWYSNIADLRQKYFLVVFMRDNAGENKSQEIIDFIESIGATNRFSTSYEQWQNGLAESAINSIMRLARTVMAESGLGRIFWFKAAAAGVVASNVTCKHRLWETPWTRVYGSPKDVSRFRAFRLCISILTEEKRESILLVRSWQFISGLSPTPAHNHLQSRKTNAMVNEPGAVRWTFIPFSQDINS